MTKAKVFIPTPNLLPVIKLDNPVEIHHLIKMVKERYDIIQPEEKPVRVTDYHATWDAKDRSIYFEKGRESYLAHPLVKNELLYLCGMTESLAKNAPKLFEDTLNEAIQSERVYGGKDRIFRLRSTEKKVRIVGAIVTPRYREIDDKEYAIALPSLINIDEWQASMIRIEDSYTHLRLTHKKTDMLRYAGEHFKNALDIKNSEVKQSSVRIQFLKWVLTCGNGAYVSYITDFLRICHQTGGSPFGDTFKALLKNAQEYGWKAISHQFDKAAQIDVPNPEYFITKSIKVIGAGLKKEMAEFVKGEFERNPGKGTLYDLSMAYSKAAQSYEKDDRFALERAGGQILEYDNARMLLPVKVNVELLKNDFVLPQNMRSAAVAHG